MFTNVARGVAGEFALVLGGGLNKPLFIDRGVQIQGEDRATFEPDEGNPNYGSEWDK